MSSFEGFSPSQNNQKNNCGKKNDQTIWGGARNIHTSSPFSALKSGGFLLSASRGYSAISRIRGHIFHRRQGIHFPISPNFVGKRKSGGAVAHRIGGQQCFGLSRCQTFIFLKHQRNNSGHMRRGHGGPFVFKMFRIDPAAG